MPDRDALAATLTELRLMSGRDRRAILAALEPEDRARAEALLDGRGEPAPAAGEAPALPHWLAERLDPSDRRVTPATRRALGEALRDTSGRGTGEAATAPRGRSLLGTVGAFLKRGAAAL